MMAWYEVALGIYLTANLIAFFAFLLDKRHAVRHMERRSESSLLTLSFMGPFGAFAAMRLSHHKTRKSKFLLVPIFMLTHLVIAFILLYQPLVGFIFT